MMLEIRQIQQRPDIFDQFHSFSIWGGIEFHVKVKIGI